MDEAYAPAYVEDLDVGYRAWQRGWPSVFVAGAVVEHRHRATTSRFFTEAQLAEILEINYLRFLSRAVEDRRLFRKLWREAAGRLWRRRHGALRKAAGIARAGGQSEQVTYSEERFLALTCGDVAMFAGKDASAPPLVLMAERLEAPEAEVLNRHREVVVVRRGNETARAAAVEWMERKWRARDKWAGGATSREARLPKGS
jgi:hypothetical protein